MPKRTVPWKRKNPNKTHTKLTPAQRAEAEESARKAERPYPNLIDNMRVAAKARKRKSTPQ